MLDFENALAIVESRETRFPLEAVPLLQGMGRYLPEPLTSPIDSPPFHKSAMDGYALQSGDESPAFTIVETIAAGAVPTQKITQGTCAKIMTGAMLPEGADRVIRVEYTRNDGQTMIPLRSESGENVIWRGENLKAGEPILGPRRLHPRDIGIIAAFGYDQISVTRRPVVGILITGSELKNPGEQIDPGEIYDSNGSQLFVQIEEAGGVPRPYGIVKDEPRLLEPAIRQALAECDVIILTGGVSMGDFDFVPALLEPQGVKILFHSVAIKPGKPTLFGEKNHRYVYGLPGNPVPSFIIFELLVKPLFYRFAGLFYRPVPRKSVLADRIERRDTKRMEFIPIRTVQDTIIPVPYHGSAHLNALGDADGWIVVPKGVQALEKGERVDVRPF